MSKSYETILYDWTHIKEKTTQKNAEEHVEAEERVKKGTDVRGVIGANKKVLN